MCLKMFDIENRINSYIKDTNSYPTSLTNLITLNESGKSYLKKIPKDFWKSQFQYKKTTNSFDIFSLGEDKIKHTQDDIYLSQCNEK